MGQTRAPAWAVVVLGLRSALATIAPAQEILVAEAHLHCDAEAVEILPRLPTTFRGPGLTPA